MTKLRRNAMSKNARGTTLPGSLGPTEKTNSHKLIFVAMKFIHEITACTISFHKATS